MLMGAVCYFVVAIREIVAVRAATAQVKVEVVEVVAAEVPKVATAGRNGIVTLVTNVVKALAMMKMTFPSVVMRVSSD